MTLQAAARSYYSATAHAEVRWRPLAESIACDVCVVGGGIAGCSVALHLVERGFRVVLLEAQRIGWGASGRSGGQALVGVASGQSVIEHLIGTTAARAIWDTTLAAVALIKERIIKYAIACDWADGYMQVALKPRHERELRAELEMLREHYQYEQARYVTRAEVRALLGTARYTGAIYDATSGHLHPLNYTLGLARAATERGALLFEGTRALDFESDGALRVRTASGHVSCRYLSLCGNVYLGALAPVLARKIMPIATHIVATEPLGADLARSLIVNNAAVSDMNWVLDYFRLSADHRLLFGGRVSLSARDPHEVTSSTRARMLKVFPQLAKAQIAYSWGGHVDVTLNRAPHFGRLMPGVFYLQGFSGHGIALAGIAGKLVADAIAGTAERFDVFARIHHHSIPGGPGTRRALLQLALLYYHLRDLL
jgi:gamma-glutamylputrescine oxidase